jgi:hypothetical protein
LDRLTLDDFADVAYDDPTHLAAAVFHTPIALISLIGFERQWFKSRVDRDDTGIPLEAACGNEAIKRPGEVMAVEDARLDPRFATDSFEDAKSANGVAYRRHQRRACVEADT